MAKFILGSHLRHRAVESRAAAHVLWFVDLAFIGTVSGFFRVLPLPWASATGARFGRFLGRFFRNRTRHVRAGLNLAYVQDYIGEPQLLKELEGGLQVRYYIDEKYLRCKCARC